jgi:hypothetical protein
MARDFTLGVAYVKAHQNAESNNTYNYDLDIYCRDMDPTSDAASTDQEQAEGWTGTPWFQGCVKGIATP